MKVLHVCEYVKGGIATYLKEVIRFQKHDARISEVSIALSRYNSDDIGLEFSDLNVYYYNYKRKSRYFLKAILQIKNIINEIEPDVIHIHSTFAGVFVRTIYFFKRKRPKIVYCSHGWSFLMETNILKRFFYGMIERLLTYKTDLIINISKYELLGSLKYRIPQNKSVVIYNGLTSKTKKKENIDIKLDEDSINLCFVGRFDEQKGLDILVNFINNNVFNNINLYLIGDGVLNSSNITLNNNIIPLGWVNNDIIDSYYEIFDAVIVPSRWEGFGLVAIEAMRNKKAVIASRRGALPEIVTDKVTGYLFDLNDLNQLKNLFVNLDKEKLKVLGENGYKKFIEQFSSKKMNKRIIKEYIRLLSSKKDNSGSYVVNK